MNKTKKIKNEVKLEPKYEPVETTPTLTDDDDIILLDDDPQDLQANKLVSEVDDDDKYISTDNKVEAGAEDKEEVKDDDIEVVKANIYKFQGNLTHEQEVNEDILSFDYWDNYEDDDVEIFDVTMDEEDKTEVEVEKDENSDNCSQSNDDEINHEKKQPPIEKKQLKQFGGGNFFMLAA